MQNNIEMIENMLNTERRNRRGNREIRFEVNSNYYEAVSKLLSDYKRVLKKNEELLEVKVSASANNRILELEKENEELKAEMKDGVIGIKLYALQTENEKLKKKIDLMENYMVENGWEICFDNIYAELNNCNGMERDWCRGDELEKQDIHKYFSKKLLESEE